MKEDLGRKGEERFNTWFPPYFGANRNIIVDISLAGNSGLIKD